LRKFPKNLLNSPKHQAIEVMMAEARMILILIPRMTQMRLTQYLILT
jgi:hypothetical protein